MCLVSKPKIPQPSAADASGQNLPIIHNTLLDNLATEATQGNNPFRIDLINPLSIPGGPNVGSVSGFGGAPAPAAADLVSGSGSSTGGSGSSSGGTSGGSFSGSGSFNSTGGRVNRF